MGFCVYYDSDFKYINQIQELKIKYKTNDKEGLMAFLEKFKDTHRLIVEIPSLKNISLEQLATIKLAHPDYNFVLAIDEFNLELIPILDESGLPYYFNKVVTNIDQFNNFLLLNVTDILVGENLGFHAKSISKLAKKNGKRLRVFLNVAQSSWSDEKTSIRDFFIRPDDVDLYSKYFDTFEFWEEKGRQNVLYEIYGIDKYWYGRLKDLIVGYKSDELNANLTHLFAEKRIDCGKKCAYGERCVWCNNLQKLAQTLNQKQILVRRVDNK